MNLYLDSKFRGAWRHYVGQTLLATAAIFVVILVLQMRNAVVVASIGATTFIVFAMPEAPTARPRHVIGGHCVGLACGAFWGLVPHATPLAAAVVYALAVGCSMFAMVVTETEHPPASGTALGVTMTGFSPALAISIVASVALLSLVKRLFKSQLKDLM